MTGAARPERAASPGADGERFREIARRLEEAHGSPRKERRDPLDELVHTILSQNTNDRNRDRAWEELRETFGSWEEVRDAERERLEETIRVAGLAGQKAAAIQGALGRLGEERGELSLDHLEELSDEEALRYLSAFRGVGVKTAACVVSFALRRPIIPVDTHVRRVSERLGLVPEGSGAERAHEVLNATVPPALRLPLHLLLIRHGREVCRARRPRCEGCPLEEICPKVGVEERP